MSTSIQISLEEVQARLPEIIHGLGAGDEVIITEGSHKVARLLGPPRGKRQPRKPGSARGKLKILTEDTEHLTDFKDYML